MISKIGTLDYQIKLLFCKKNQLEMIKYFIDSPIILNITSDKWLIKKTKIQ